MAESHAPLTPDMPLPLNFLLAVQVAARTHPSHSSSSISPLVISGALLVVAGLVCDAIIINRFVPRAEFRVTEKPWNLRDLGIVVAVLVGVFLLSNALYVGIATVRQGKNIN